MNVKSIKIISNNECLGSEPKANDEIEQYLTIDADGNVWFKAINYEQFFGNKELCRDVQLNIEPWKAKHLFDLIWTMEKPLGGTDAGLLDIRIELENGKSAQVYGTLYESPKTFYGINTKTVSKVKI